MKGNGSGDGREREWIGRWPEMEMVGLGWRVEWKEVGGNGDM